MTTDLKMEYRVVVLQQLINTSEIPSSRYIEMEYVHSDAMMASHMVKKICTINDGRKTLLKSAIEKLGFPHGPVSRY